MRHVASFGFFLLLAFHAPAAGTNLLTRVDVAANLTAEECPEPRPFDFVGTALEGTSRVTPFCAGSVGIKVENHTPTGTTWRAGDRLRIRGELEISPDDQAFFRVRALEVLSHGTLPPPEDVTGEAVANGDVNYRLVRIRGVISSITRDELYLPTVWMVIRTSTGPVLVSFSSYCLDYDRIRSLVDAEVECVGLAQPTSGWRHHLGNHLSLRTDLGDGALKVLRPPPSDPFAAPPFKNATVCQRQRMDGTVAAVGDGRFFLRTSRGRFVAVFPVAGTELPAQGAVVTVVGFADMDPFRLEFREALVRAGGQARPSSERPRDIDIEQIFVGPGNNAYRINTSLRGELLCVRAVVRDRLSEDGRLMSLTLTSGRRTIYADVSALFGSESDGPAIGATVRLTGFLLPEFESAGASRILPYFRRFTFVPRDAADIAVLAQPPWWTPARLFLVILSLLAALSAILIWNIALKRKSERRGRELSDERIRHAVAEEKVEERTRLAVELHDSISQTLTGIAFQLDGDKVESAKKMLASCREELRCSLWDLRSRTFEEKDMTEAIQRTLAPHAISADITVRFNVPRERLSESTTHAILRIVRELTVNAIRHGRARHVRIAGECHDGTISFSVQDDGCGFDPNAAPGPTEGHFGLLGVRERLKAFGGTFTVESRPQRGAKVILTLKENSDDVQ